MKFSFDTVEEVKAFLAFVQGTRNQGDAIMSLLDDLKAAQAATAEALQDLTTNVGQIGDAVTAVKDEVVALIALIGNSTGVPQDVVDAANALKASVSLLVTQTQAVEDQIAAIPQPPAVG